MPAALLPIPISNQISIHELFLLSLLHFLAQLEEDKSVVPLIFILLGFFNILEFIRDCLVKISTCFVRVQVLLRNCSAGTVILLLPTIQRRFWFAKLVGAFNLLITPLITFKFLDCEFSPSIFQDSSKRLHYLLGFDCIKLLNLLSRFPVGNKREFFPHLL